MVAPPQTADSLYYGFMGFHVLVRGSMTVAPNRFAGWKRGKVSPKKFSDWAQHAYASPDETPSVATLLERYARWLEPSDHEYLRLTVEKSKVTIEGQLQETSFNDMAGLVGALWRSAARFGGEGELVFSGVGIDLEDRIVLDGRRSRFVTKHRVSKINAKTTPEDAQEAVWLHVMNDQMTAARRSVSEYLAAKRPIVPAIAYEFLSAFEGAVDKAGPIVDAITNAIDEEIAGGVSRTWRDVDFHEGDALRAFKSDYLDKLLWTLNEMGREKQCRTLFESWRDSGGEVSLSNYSRYFFALVKSKTKGPVAPALDAFEALWAKIRKKARASGDAGAIFVNPACAAAMIDDRARAKRFIQLALDHGYPAAKLAADPDLASLRSD